MSTIKTSGNLLGAGIISALLASSCCIIPLLALIAGSSGLASSFGWIEPARPYLIALSLSVLGFAWYQKLKPVKVEEDCCAVNVQPRFIQSKTFLGIITVFALSMMAFPFYSTLFSGNNSNQVNIIGNPANIQIIEFNISGMTCTGCEGHIEHAVNDLPGIMEVNASYEKELTTISFDSTLTSVQQIEKAIESTGYTIDHDEPEK